MKVIYKKQNMFLLVEQWRETDLTQTEYAEQQGINFATFKYWCRKHYEEALRSQKDQKSTFIEIDRHQIFSKVERKPQIELDLPSGLRLKIYLTFY